MPCDACSSELVEGAAFASLSDYCVYTDPGSGLGMVFYFQDEVLSTQSEGSGLPFALASGEARAAQARIIVHFASVSE